MILIWNTDMLVGVDTFIDWSVAIGHMAVPILTPAVRTLVVGRDTRLWSSSKDIRDLVMSADARVTLVTRDQRLVVTDGSE